jgi:(1->4)-alpha-D-glucan 1-alpha-D-glucosylmutase
MVIPSSTYRVQLNDHFTLKDLREIIPYLHELGISTIYASPITTAIKGSQHGYDVADPRVLNPEIGSERELEQLVGILRNHGMSWLQDIVPNHMAYDPQNPWLNDVLRRGSDSPYCSWFDIMTTPPVEPFGDKLMAPFLGDTLEACLQKGELSLHYTDNGWVIRYYDKDYPAAGDPDGKDLASVVKDQHYVLTQARLAARVINYRRFFTINSLICLRMEKEEVFKAWHETILRWYQKGWINGLRVDHLDGLAGPKTYLQRLKNTFGKDCFVVAEKILAQEETVPTDWPMEGTTGYDFLGAVNQVLTDADGSRELLDFYTTHIIELCDYETIVYGQKLNFLCRYMGGELSHLLSLLPEGGRGLREALAVWMSSFPVYRAYPDEDALSSTDQQVITQSIARAKQRRPDLSSELDRLIGTADIGFLPRLMQFTGPLAAKGVEDTTFYLYNPYISHCEVGDSPATAGTTVEEFHHRMETRLANQRHSLNAGSTHDTKRGEDSRIRLNFLSSIPNVWVTAVAKWRRLNLPFIRCIGGRPAPSPNDEYLIYQSLLGAFPVDGIVTDEFRNRFSGWLRKALREAKTETNYDDPDKGYEEQCLAFVQMLLSSGSDFFRAFAPFAADIIRGSSPYCLSQLLLKLTAPGIPDIYQGADLWELSLVDPDNRRPVDYSLRTRLLGELAAAAKGRGPAPPAPPALAPHSNTPVTIARKEPKNFSSCTAPSPSAAGCRNCLRKANISRSTPRGRCLPMYAGMTTTGCW